MSPASPSILDAIRAVNATAEKKRRREEEKRRRREGEGGEGGMREEEKEEKQPHPANATTPPAQPTVSRWREQYRARHTRVVGA